MQAGSVPATRGTVGPRSRSSDDLFALRSARDPTAIARLSGIFPKTAAGLPRSGRSLLRCDSPNLIKQRLRRDGAPEELFQQGGSIKFFSEAQQMLAGPRKPLRIAAFKWPQRFPRVLPQIGGDHRTQAVVDHVSGHLHQLDAHGPP